MLHLVLCFSVWILISTFLFWRLIAIAKTAVDHLKRLHQVPCSNCAYFTGDYRLKCTVNPLDAMSETAIGCRDFIIKSDCRSNNQGISSGGCFAKNKFNHTETKEKRPAFKLK
ncbi:MAG: hypothetical protein QNJ53_12235 [Pleurocapsa sp. MO_192.B19]|nr:hypothetical protein [Pleurocapsa sp. MO_192.B19]